MLVTAEEAKELMDSTDDYVLVDVRTEEEYEEGHIPGAILIPHDEIEDRAEEELPDMGQTILVYCRSGNRSAQVADILEEMGYRDVQDFGGIQDWPFEIEE